MKLTLVSACSDRVWVANHVPSKMLPRVRASLFSKAAADLDCAARSLICYSFKANMCQRFIRVYVSMVRVAMGTSVNTPPSVVTRV